MQNTKTLMLFLGLVSNSAAQNYWDDFDYKPNNTTLPQDPMGNPNDAMMNQDPQLNDLSAQWNQNGNMHSPDSHWNDQTHTWDQDANLHTDPSIHGDNMHQHEAMWDKNSDTHKDTLSTGHAEHGPQDTHAGGQDWNSNDHYNPQWHEPDNTMHHGDSNAHGDVYWNHDDTMHHDTQWNPNDNMHHDSQWNPNDNMHHDSQWYPDGYTTHELLQVAWDKTAIIESLKANWNDPDATFDKDVILKSLDAHWDDPVNFVSDHMMPSLDHFDAPWDGDHHDASWGGDHQWDSDPSMHTDTWGNDLNSHNDTLGTDSDMHQDNSQIDNSDPAPINPNDNVQDVPQDRNIEAIQNLNGKLHKGKMEAAEMFDQAQNELVAPQSPPVGGI